MLLVFPVSSVDAHLALQVAEWMRTLGPYGRHKALLVWSSELPPEKRAPIVDHFKAMDWQEPPRALTVTIKDHEQTWPTAANVIFRETAKMIAAVPELRCPWYFFEPDCTPMHARWMDVLADLYNQDLSKPFLGCVQDTFNVVGNERIKVGEHLVGTAIYPPVLEQFTRLHLRPSFAFDHAISQDIMPHVRDTKLIQHNWSTGRYHLCPFSGRSGKPLQIRCSKVTLRFTQTGQAIDHEVRIGAMVLHGCKDGTLIECLKLRQKIACPEGSEVLKTLGESPFLSKRLNKCQKRRAKRLQAQVP